MCHYTVPQLILFKKKAGEMGLWLRAQVALSEDLFGSQHPHVGSSLSMTPVPRGCDSPLRSISAMALDIHGAKIYMRANYPQT